MVYNATLMSFILKQGKTKIMWLPVTASTALSNNSLVAWSSGKLIAATNSTPPSTIAGVLRKAVTSADADYAVERLVPVEVPCENNCVWEATTTGTAVAADAGLYADISDAVTVNRAASTYDVVQIVRVASATKTDVILNIGVAGCGVIGA